MARVLIVDDERSLRRTLGEFLRGEGHLVVEAEDADVAERCLRSETFDVVVSDIVLPRVNGVELLRRVRVLAPEVQVVMMTGEPTAETASESLRAGAVDYLFKPITKAGIIRAVATAARLKALHDEKARLEAENRAYQENLERLVQERTGQLRQELARRAQVEVALRESEGRLEALFEHSPVAIWEEDFSQVKVLLEAIQTRGVEDLAAYLKAHPEEMAACVAAVKVLRINAASAALFGVSKEELPRDLPTYFTSASLRVFADELAALALGQTQWEGEIPVRSPKGDDRSFHISLSMIPGHQSDWSRVVVSFTDVTERNRVAMIARREAKRTELLLDLHQRAPRMADRALFDFVLEKAVELTDSAIGFFHQVAEDQKTIILTTWNQQALENCTASFETHYPLDEAGNWVDCVRQKRAIVYNSFAQSPNQRGLPPGHTALRRFMSIPVIQDGLVRIIFGVGNKATDYDAADVAQLQLVANELHKLMLHRTAEHQLRQLSKAVEQSPSIIMITDRKGTIEYVNPKFTQTTGYSLEEARGRNPRFLKSGALPAAFYRNLWESILAGREWRGEFHNKTRNGEGYWESAVISSITEPGGEITHFVAVKEEITQRKRMEAFRQGLLSLGASLNATHDPRQAGRALLAAADQLWQWDSATFDIIAVGTDLLQAVVYVDTIDGERQELPIPAAARAASPRMQRVMANGAELILREVVAPVTSDSVPFGDRNRLSASIMVVPIRKQDQHLGILSVQSYRPQAYTQEDLQTLQALADYCSGALERMRSEDALRQSEERYRGLVETSCDWIWEVDAQARYTFASPKVQAILGYTPEELLGRTPFEIMPDLEAVRVQMDFARIVAAREPFSMLENVCVHKDGHEVVLETSGVPILGPQGELLGYRGMDRNISEHKRLEALFRQAQKLEGIGQLAGGVAHDFNNILAAILMQLGLLRMSANLDEESCKALKEMETEARRAANLTRQLLMFSRRSVLSVQPLDLNELVANMLKMLCRLIGEHITLRFDSSAGLPSIEADAGMLEQVLMNLVVNARDAMPKGGHVTIATQALTVTGAESLTHPDRRPGHYVCLAVTDSGCGMDEGTLKRIFEPFFTTKEAGKGTGLGLATVHGIVAQHKGWVEVVSKVGRGTTFRVMLPVMEKGAAAVPAVQAEEEPLDRGQECILLVEDEQTVREQVGRFLRLLGYRVHEAATGQRAMAMWRAHSEDIDLLITDMIMPEGMTGLELTERLQALRPGLRAIISSGYSAEIVQAGVPDKAGVIYLPKPYETSQLARCVRNCLDMGPRQAPVESK